MQSRLYKINKINIFNQKKFAHIKKKQYFCIVIKNNITNN